MDGRELKILTIIPLLVVGLEIIVTPVYAYVLPNPRFELLQPRGVRVSIPGEISALAKTFLQKADEAGLQLFGFHGNVNRRISLGDNGEVSGEVYRARDGRWIFEDQRIQLRDNDVINYWIYAQANGMPHRKDNLSWTVKVNSERINDKQPSTSNTTPTGTQGQLILEDNFDSLDQSLWTREIKMPLSPDYEFCVYHDHNHEQLLTFDGGIMRMKPILLEDHYGENATIFGRIQLAKCTSNIVAECTRHALAYSILPPVISIRLTTKNRFNFRYGKVEIRAKFPEGDWLYPEMWLEPRYSIYGPEYTSGRVLLGAARGNENLVRIDDVSQIYDSRKLEFGVRTGSSMDIRDDIVSRINENGPRWTEDFHVYTTMWNEEGFTFLVDGQNVGHLTAATSNWLRDNTTTANSGRKAAPFDQEFYITFGIGVGGLRVFPDRTRSSGFQKPWKNTGAKAMLKFWAAKDQWLPTWRRSGGTKTTFEVDYVRVWSL